MRQDMVRIEWYESIFKRSSRRSYYSTPIALEKFEALVARAQELSGDGLRIELVLMEDGGLFKGLVGGYGKIQGMPAYIAFVGDQRDPHVSTKVGYYGEGMILEATGLGLDTCWVYATFDRTQVNQQLALAEHERVIAVSPIGLSTAGYGSTDRIFKFLSQSKKRRSLNDLVDGAAIYELPDWIVGGLTAVQVAPSAANGQPWKFRISPDSVALYRQLGLVHRIVSPEIDFGIAMLHFELGAMERGRSGKWKLLAGPDVANFVVDPR